MIYLKHHKKQIQKELKAFLKRNIKSEQIEENFLHSEFPSEIFEDIAQYLENCFKSYMIEFLLKYGEDHDLTFKQLKDMIGK